MSIPVIWIIYLHLTSMILITLHMMTVNILLLWSWHIMTYCYTFSHVKCSYCVTLSAYSFVMQTRIPIIKGAFVNRFWLALCLHQVLLEQVTSSPWNNFLFLMYYGLIVESKFLWSILFIFLLVFYKNGKLHHRILLMSSWTQIAQSNTFFCTIDF